MRRCNISVGFTGTRRGMKPAQAQAVQAALQRLVAERGVRICHHGACVGADREFDNIAREVGVPRYAWPSNAEQDLWARDRGIFQAAAPLSPLKRNKAIVGMSDILLAAPREHAEVLHSGTWATIRYARRAGIEIQIARPDGAIEIEPGK